MKQSTKVVTLLSNAMLQVTHLRRYPGPRMVTQLIKALTTSFSVKTIKPLPLTMFKEMTLEFMYAMQRTTSTLFLRLLILMCNVSQISLLFIYFFRKFICNDRYNIGREKLSSILKVKT